jgi:hypothetical protein
MKTKSIDRAIASFTNKIKTVKKKGLNEHAGQAKTILQTMEADLKTSIILQKEVHELKDSLKIKKKELDDFFHGPYKQTVEGMLKAEMDNANPWITQAYIAGGVNTLKPRNLQLTC